MIMSEFEVAQSMAEMEDPEGWCYIQSILEQEEVDLKKHKLIHSILMVVAREGFVNIGDIPVLALRHFGITVACTDWGFKDMIALVEDYVVKQHSEAIDYTFFDFKSQEEPNSSQDFNYFGLESFVRHFYLIGKRIPGATNRFKDFRLLHENSNDMKYAAARKKRLSNLKRRPSFLEDMISNLEDASYVSDDLSSGLITYTICTGCLTPSNFSVVMELHLSRHENIYDMLQDEKKNKKWFDYIPSEDLVRLGQIVLVSSPILDPEDPEKREWSRGKVIRIIKEPNSEETIYRIRQLDFGSDCLETIENIRLAPRQLMEEAEVLAICCRLTFDDPKFEKKSKRGIWSRKEIELFRSLCLNKKMIVHFKKRSKISGYSSKMKTNLPPITDCSYSKRLPKDAKFWLPLGEKGRWEVSAETLKTSLDEEDRQDIEYSDLATTFVRKLGEMKATKKSAAQK